MLGKSIVYLISNEKNRFGLPLPPPRLRYWVHGNTNADSFIESGREAFAASSALIQKSLICPIDKPQLLDLGCGCARVLRHYFQSEESYEYVGTDINEKAIQWNRKNLFEYAKWDINQSKPPLDYPEGQFDIVLANSLFTHLDEEYQDLWLKEVGRILSKDGIAILTIHDIENSWPGNVQRPSEQELNKGIYVRRINIGIRNFAGFPEFYQSTYHTKDYIFDRWSNYLDLVWYLEKGVEQYQSVVIAKKL